MTYDYCCVQCRVVMWVRCNIIVLVATAWPESFCQWGRVAVVVHCWAVEYGDFSSQRPTRDPCYLTTIDEASRCQWMWTEHDHWRPLHSPTHTYTSVATWWTEQECYTLSTKSFCMSTSIVEKIVNTVYPRQDPINPLNSQTVGCGLNWQIKIVT